MMTKIFIGTIAISLLFSSCNSSPANFEGGAPSRVAMMAPPVPAEVENADPMRSVQPIGRMLIRNGQIEFTTNDIQKTRKEIEKICKNLSAYISSEDQQSFDGRLQFQQVIRVPQQQFDAFLKFVETLSIRIDSRTINSQDVTDEFIDLSARLKTKKSLEERYLQLLTKAKSVKDMLDIEGEITTVRSEIESMQGRINYISNQVEHSTLTLTYYQEIPSQDTFSTKASLSFENGWEGFVRFVVGLISIWPFAVFFGFVIWLLVRWMRKRNIHRESVSASE